MKYCIYCGTQLTDDADFCTNCGKSAGALPQNNTQTTRPVQSMKEDDKSTLKLIINIFLIIGCVANAIATLGIALAWCIPMTLRIRDRMRDNVPVGIGLKVCTLLFVHTIAGICLLVLEDGS